MLTVQFVRICGKIYRSIMEEIKSFIWKAQMVLIGVGVLLTILAILIATR